MNESVNMENDSESEAETNVQRGSIAAEDQNRNELTMVEQEDNVEEAAVNILPDEILENIFGRLLPYEDLDNVKSVSQRWNRVVKKVILSLGNGFEKSFRDGSLKCETISTVYDDSHHVVGSWISERFGHMCCYYDRAMYVVGGTTHSPTTFNDMWMFDLNSRSWTRILASGKFPTPKALGSFVQYKDKFVMFGGTQPGLRNQPIRIFDELHMFDIPAKKWSQVITQRSPHPSAGHSASVHGNIMIIFGGRNFNQKEPSYPISNSTWIFDFIGGEWHEVSTNEPPAPRYGQTQVVIDDTHALIIGGCGGPNQIFSDVWLLTIENIGNNNYTGNWLKMVLRNPKNEVPHHDFHYSGCKVGSSVVFFQRPSSLSPYLAFLHFDSWRPPQGNPTQLQHQGNIIFEPNTRSRSYFHSRCSSGLRQQTTATMLIYSLDISKVLIDGSVEWSKEPDPPTKERPKERMLYSMVAGRAELVIFGGFFRSDSNGISCRVSNDLFILRTIHKTY